MQSANEFFFCHTWNIRLPTSDRGSLETRICYTIDGKSKQYYGLFFEILGISTLLFGISTYALSRGEIRVFEKIKCFRNFPDFSSVFLNFVGKHMFQTTFLKLLNIYFGKYCLRKNENTFRTLNGSLVVKKSDFKSDFFSLKIGKCSAKFRDRKRFFWKIRY